MKIQQWTLTEDGETHTVTCRMNRVRGKLYVAIDGEEFALSAGLFGCRAKRREPFRLCDEQAVLVVDGLGRAVLLFRGKELPPTVQA